MPIVEIKIAKGRSVEIKEKLVRTLTDDIVRILNVNREWVTVLINEYDRENWATGGELHSIKYGDGYGMQDLHK